MVINSLKSFLFSDEGTEYIFDRIYRIYRIKTPGRAIQGDFSSSVSSVVEIYYFIPQSLWGSDYPANAKFILLGSWHRRDGKYRLQENPPS